MSLNKRKELSIVAKKLCRELRANQTHSEEILWDRIRNRQLLGKKFLRQHPIFYDLKGRETFSIADFYCHEIKFVVEIDGEIHKLLRKNDYDRDQIMNLVGLQVMRIKSEKVIDDLNGVLKSLENYINKFSNSL
jgi:very-short-patch-repair endonuclease